MISDERLTKALHYRATTDEPCAHLKAQVARLEYACKLARARQFLLSDCGSVEAKKADAEKSHDVQAAEGKLADAIEEYEKVQAKRKTEELVIDVWRTISANRRQGNI